MRSRISFETPALPASVCGLVELLLHVGPRWLVFILEVRDVALEEISECSGARIPRRFDTSALQNELRVIAAENLTRVCKRQCRIRSDLGFGPAAVAPLLHHPLSCHASWHRLKN